MWPSGYYRQTPLVSHVRALNAARKAATRANKFYHTTQVRGVFIILAYATDIYKYGCNFR